MLKSEEYLLLDADNATFDKGFCLWWRPNERGYTIRIEEAGRYDKQRAEELEKSMPGHVVKVSVARAEELMWGVVSVDLRRQLFVEGGVIWNPKQ